MRITGGTLGGRHIDAPPGLSTRPTTDAVRHSLFAILEGLSVFPETIVVDLFCGSGVLGFECLSRGAASVLFCDSNAAVCRLVRQTAITLGVADRVTIVKADALALVDSPTMPVADLVLADPPYAMGAANGLRLRLERRGTLRADGILCLEHGESEVLLDDPAWTPVRQLHRSSTVVDIVRRTPSS